MKPYRHLAETLTPDCATLALYEHDGTYCIRLNGRELMDSAAPASELMLGELGTSRLLSRADPCILIGGLGLGFTLKSVLERVGPQAKVLVVELVPEIVEWNRRYLSGLNAKCLDDCRVEILTADVCDVIGKSGRDRFDAILLDVDNGPADRLQRSNARLYYERGIRSMARALKPGGRVAVWSARQDAGFMKRLNRAGFRVESVPAKHYAQAKRPSYTIYVADQGRSSQPT